MKMKKKTFPAVLSVLLIAMLFVGTFIVGSIIKIASIGYITGYQGLQAEFEDVYFKSYWYDVAHLGPNPNYLLWKDKKASAGEFFDHLNLDPDSATTYLPNLCASQQPIVVDETVEPKRWLWRIPLDEQTETGQNATHTWTITWQNYKEFQLLRYRAEWAVNIWLSGTGDEAYPDETRIWRDAQIWIKLNPKQFVYFLDNPDKVYFSPALVQLQSLEWYSFETSKDSEVKDSEISRYEDLIPKAPGETLGIFYEKGGAAVNLEEKIVSYENHLLDPSIFRDQYYVRISLLQFQAESWWKDWLHLTGWAWKYPSVKLKFLVHIFVVGEWTVRLQKGEIVELKPHEPTVNPPGPLDAWGQFWSGVQAWFGDPFNKLAVAFFGLLIIVVVILLFTPIGSVVAVALGRRVARERD